MRHSIRPASGFLPARAIPATAWLVGTTLAVSLLGAITQRKWQLGLSQLNYQRDAVLDLELWRLLTYPFVESTFLGLALGLVVLWLFGGWFETTYGSRDFLRFFFLSTCGAGLLAIPLSMLVNLIMPFYDTGLAEGPDPALDAMLVAMALQAPNSNILFGFVMPMRARTVILVILGIELVMGIQSGAAALSTSLGGMLMGYLLVTGMWRPSRLVQQLRYWTLRRRSGLYVVPPRGPTLH